MLTAHLPPDSADKKPPLIAAIHSEVVVGRSVKWRGSVSAVWRCRGLRPTGSGRRSPVSAGGGARDGDMAGRRGTGPSSARGVERGAACAWDVAVVARPR